MVREVRTEPNGFELRPMRIAQEKVNAAIDEKVVHPFLFQDPGEILIHKEEAGMGMGPQPLGGRQ